MIDSKNGIIGFVVGDAMGVPIEFNPREKLEQNMITTMQEYGTHNMPKGCWSDDSSMTLATIDSITERHKIDSLDIANKFIEWIRKGKYTATGRVFDYGTTTFQALRKIEGNLVDVESAGGDREIDNGNGSLMRMLPIAYYCYSKEYKDYEVYNIVKRISSITHRHEISIMGCYIYVMYAISLLKKLNKEEAYSQIKKIDYSMFSLTTQDKFRRILEDNINEYHINDVSSQGYVVSTLESVLWVLLNTNDYNSSIIKAINLGEDTDTVGACTGGLAGIIYGIENINQQWKSEILKYNYIIELCDKFDIILNCK